MTDSTRDLIQQLADELDTWLMAYPDVQPARHYHYGVDLLAKARAYLDQPEPEGLTDEEILNLSEEHGVSYTTLGGFVIHPYQEVVDIKDDVLSFARAVIAADRARAYLAQPEPEYPSDKELLKLMPETMRDEFSYAAKVCSDATGGQVKPRIFRVALNTAALEYAQAILAHYTF